MYRVRTLSDHIVLFVGSALVAAMGVLFFVLPPRLLPTDPAAYDAVSGRLVKLADRSGRKASRVVFMLRGDTRVFETRSVRWRGGADAWVEGETSLRFHIESQGPASGTDHDPVTVYGLVADRRAGRSLAEDIAYANATAGPWAGVLALSLGVAGMAVAVLVWRKRPA